MPKFIDLTNRRFGSLTALSLAGGRRGYWRCRCDCGNEKIVQGGHLRSGDTVSCGCRVPAICRERNHKHGLARSPTHVSWCSAKNRCFNTRTPRYRDYGARGISMCERWKNDFRAFLADMGERPAGTSLDRIDNDGHYEPGNCRWADTVTQRRNRR